MIQEKFDKRNFLFFLNKIYPLKLEDSLIGAFATPSSWDAVKKMINTSRQENAFVRSIKRVLLYVHVPFCGRICTYCHCTRVLLQRRADVDAYIKSLTGQITFFAPAYKGMDASSICFGGGTPSILDEKQMATILDSVDKAFPVSQRKILIEVNPSSWTPSKLALLKSRGLYRLSIGVESMDEGVLKRVSRSQTREKVLWSLRSARKAGVPHVNVDLMAGLPGQTLESFIEDLKILIDEGASIVHIYPYCSLSRKELCAPGEKFPSFFKRRDAMMKAAEEILKGAGFSRKGLEAYTRDGKGEEDQEEVYLRLESAVAAFGPSALGGFPGSVFYRMGELKSPEDLSAIDVCAQDPAYAMSHYALFALMNELDENLFLKRFGVSLDGHCGEGLRYLKQLGLVASSQGIWKYAGKWEIRQMYEFVALSRVLFGEDILLRLRKRFVKQYNPRHDYSEGDALLNAYANPWLMNLYYKLGY